MAKLHFRSYTTNQMVLFPQRIDENIAENDPVRIVSSIVDHLDMSSVNKLYNGMGRCPYHPRMMLKVIIYAYMNNIYSCRRIEQLLVSVSAMQPCSASFNSLPLPREYNITNMTAAKRYESVWNAFLNELPHNPTTTLTSFLKRCNVRQGRMKRWMENNGLSVKEAKKRLRDCQHDGIGDPMSPLSEDSGSLFLPMATDKPAPRSESCDILSGVSLTFPDGTQVNIKRGSAQAVMSFLKLYQREDLPCLD